MIQVIADAIYGLNGSACLALGIAVGVITTVLIHRSPQVPVDRPRDNA